MQTFDSLVSGLYLFYVCVEAAETFHTMGSRSLQQNLSSLLENWIERYKQNKDESRRPLGMSLLERLGEKDNRSGLWWWQWTCREFEMYS
jgi:hypothetical protein